jgi:hypothetical protein
VIPDSVTSLGIDAFQGCSGLTNVVFSENLTRIQESAFAGCRSLTSITIPNAVTSIGEWAFSSCTALRRVQLGQNTTTIEASAFTESTSLTSLTIPESLGRIGNNAFFRCTALAGVYFKGYPPVLGDNVFSLDQKVVVYYLPGIVGWPSMFGGRQTALWNPRVLTSDATFGVRAGQFGFTIGGTSSLVVVVEACGNLENSEWLPLETKTLIDGTAYFSDPEYATGKNRFYRLNSP